MSRKGARAPSKADPVRVIIVDDHRSISEALGLAVDLQDDLAFLGIAETVEEGVELAGRLRPDVVVMDVRLPGVDGIEGIAQVKKVSPASRVVVLTAHGDLEVMARAASAGACGFLPKTTSVVQILEAIRAAGEGGMLVENSALEAIVRRLRDKQPSGGTQVPALTSREHEVLVLLGQGFDVVQIAKRLGISLATARGHVQRILAKLEAHSQLEAVVKAIGTGLIPSPSRGSTSPA